MEGIGETPHFYNDQRVGHVLSHFDNNVEVSNLLHSLLLSQNILRWNPQGEIVYNGISIPDTRIVKLVEYCLSKYNSDIPKPTGLNVFVKGLARVKVDKNLIENAQVLAMLARKETESDDTETEGERDEESSIENCEDEDEETESRVDEGR